MITPFIKAKMKKCLNFIGLWVNQDDTFPYSYDRTLYITTDKKKVVAHKELMNYPAASGRGI